MVSLGLELRWFGHAIIWQDSLVMCAVTRQWPLACRTHGSSEGTAKAGRAGIRSCWGSFLKQMTNFCVFEGWEGGLPCSSLRLISQKLRCPWQKAGAGAGTEHRFRERPRSSPSPVPPVTVGPEPWALQHIQPFPPGRASPSTGRDATGGSAGGR